MFSLGETAAAPQADLIKDTNEASFMADVVEASREVPVIVDFVRPVQDAWSGTGSCSHCRQRPCTHG